jgi:hypothetical protein
MCTVRIARPSELVAIGFFSERERAETASAEDLPRIERMPAPIMST